MISLLRAWIFYKIICSTISHGFMEKVVEREGVSKLSYESEKRLFHGKINPSYRVIHSRLSISRKKRSLGSTETTTVSLQLPGIEDDDSISLQLQQVDITHPDVIIRVNDQIQKSIIQRDCYFCGCENGTCATVSTCGGVTGIIEHSSGSYQLEEVSESDVEDLPGNILNNASDNRSSNSRKRRDASEKTLVMWKLDINLNEGNKYIPLPEAPPSSDSSDFVEENLNGMNLIHQEFEIVDEDIKHSTRVRRRVNGPYTVELAVFADHHHSRYMAQRYPGANIVDKTQDLVLTLMNAVHRMYDTASLGDSRLGIMVKEIDIETEDVKKHDDHDGDIYEYLSSFCSWQARKNPKGKAGEWDHALLLSGLDLWNLQKTQNSTVGLAYVGGMCANSFSCTVNEGTSLAAAYIIAHEMGHNLGMRHDGDPGAATCPKNKYLMSPVMSSGAATWSDCSKRALDNFLTKKGSCLKSSHGKTSKSVDHHGASPGQRYNADQQCHYMYGNDWTHFHNNQDPFNNLCKEIWCRKGRHLRTPTAPALEGTSCGNKKACQHALCKDEDVLIRTVGNGASNNATKQGPTSDRTTSNEKPTSGNPKADPTTESPRDGTTSNCTTLWHVLDSLLLGIRNMVGLQSFC